MDASTTKSSYHVRSNSFPTRPHPVAAQVVEQLIRLRSSESTSTSSSSICQQLSGLQDLHNSVAKFLELPLTQEALSQEQDKVDELLDGSLRILDVCNISKDALSQTKESIHEIQSIIRRKANSAAEVKKFLALRKSLKRSFQKVLKSLKASENKNTSSNDAFVVLREVEDVTSSVFESVLCFISGSKTQSNSKWSMVSKLMTKKRITCEEEESEFAKVDAALQKNSIENELQNLEQCIEDLEQALECLFRCLIKARVSILNILA